MIKHYKASKATKELIQELNDLVLLECLNQKYAREEDPLAEEMEVIRMKIKRLLKNDEVRDRKISLAFSTRLGPKTKIRKTLRRF